MADVDGLMSTIYRCSKASDNFDINLNGLLLLQPPLLQVLQRQRQKQDEIRLLKNRWRFFDSFNEERKRILFSGPIGDQVKGNLGIFLLTTEKIPPLTSFSSNSPSLSLFLLYSNFLSAF